METNPFTPPTANVAVPTSARRVNRFHVLAITVFYAIHMAVFFYYSSSFIKLIQVGALSLPGPLAGVVSDIAMLLGVALLILNRPSQLLFLIAAVFSLLAGALVWNGFIFYALILVIYGFGAAVAVSGWWVTFRHHRSTRGA